MYKHPEILPIPGYPDYVISIYGQVWSRRKTGKFKRLILSLHKHGYFYFTVYSDTSMHVYLVHDAVLDTFVRMNREKEQCRHLDGNPQNNCLWNLRWGTAKENAADTKKHGRTAMGSRLPQSKLTEREVGQIRYLLETHEEITMQEIASWFNVSRRTVSFIYYKQTWKHVSPIKCTLEEVQSEKTNHIP